MKPRLTAGWMAPAVVALALGAGAARAPGGARAEGEWLDQPAPAPWNSAGMMVPAAPPLDGNDDPRCQMTERPPETLEDGAVAAAGWQLFREYQGGWGLKLVFGLSGYDGMCRPLGYQVFVFAGGVFAGTLSPERMDSRTDGALSDVRLLAPRPAGAGDALMAVFNRYTPADPLCCPSGRTTVQYRLDRTGPAPVLVAFEAATSPTGAQAAPPPTPPTPPARTPAAAPAAPCVTPNITVSSPMPGASVEFPLAVEAVVDNSQNPACAWVVFEAVAGSMQVVDATGAVVGRGRLTTTDDWMAAGPLRYRGTVTLDRAPLSEAIRLTIAEADPSGRRPPQLVEIPLTARR